MKSWSLSVILSVLLFSQTFASSFCAKLIDARCGETHTLALSKDGYLFSCGRDVGGRLGQGACNDYVYSLKQVKGLDGNGFLKNVIAFDAGWEHSLVVTSSQICLSFGDDSYGKLGNGTYEGSSNVPTYVHAGQQNTLNPDTPLRHIVMVSAGRSGRHSLAVDANGYTYAWGLNDAKQCTGDDYQYDYPVLVASTGTDPNFTYLGDEAVIVDVEAGVIHSLALEDLFDGGHVYQWGYGNAIPFKVPDQNNTGFLSNIVDIATCGHSLAVDWNGYVWYWDSSNPYPIRVSGGAMGTTYLQNIAKVAAGSDYCTALDNNGNVWEWTGRTGTPAKVADGEQYTTSDYLENIRSLDSGLGGFNVAIDESGNGWAWGGSAGLYAGIGQNVSATTPVKMLCAEITSPFIVTKIDDVNGCIMPYDGIFDKIINYAIYVDSNSFTDSNVVLLDTLPAEVNFISCDSNGIYDPETKTIIWDIGSMSDDYNDCFHLQVELNANSIRKNRTANTAQLIGDIYITQDIKETKVCCFYDTLYVNDDAAPDGNGLSWDTAYDNLQTALQQIRDGNSCAGRIFVAAGIYPTTNDTADTTATFQLIDGVDIYGGFRGCESDPSQRNLADPNYASILTADADNDDYGDTQTVVTTADCLIDGFTVTQGINYGIYCKSCTADIANCIITQNIGGIGEGVRVDNAASVTIYNSFITNNGGAGIDCQNSGTRININKCTIQGNGFYTWAGDNGIIAYDNFSQVNITNCIFGGNCLRGINIGYGQSAVVQNCDVNDNGDGIIFSAQSGNIERCRIYRNSQGMCVLADCNIVNNIIYDNEYIGIYLSSYAANTNLLNNLIYNNLYYGIYTEVYAQVRGNTIVDNDDCGVGGYGNPSVTSNIIWGQSTSLDGTFTNVNYNCIQGGYAGTGNTSTNPQLDAEYCLTSASTSCIDNGNPNYVSDTNETDITGEFRCLNAARSTLNAVVDKGADEYNPYDLNFDSKINFMDFTELADDWQTVYDIFDVRNMCAYWLMGTDWPGIGGKGAEFAEVLYECPSQMMSVSPQLYVGGSLASIYSMRSISAEPEMAAESIPEPVDVNSLLNWLDDVWKNDEAIRESMTESEYLEFRSAIENIE
jgi:parallel beta-helix repeat protein